MSYLQVSSAHQIYSMESDHFLGFSDSSALLKHELAYCLGQMKDTTAIPVLEMVLRNESEDPMVRHEVGLQDSISCRGKFIGF